MERTVIRGNEFYEIDLECEKKKKKAHTGLVVIMTMGAKYETRRRCLGKVHQQRKH